MQKIGTEVPLDARAALPSNLELTEPVKSLRRYFEYLPDNAKCRIDECQKVISRTTGSTASMTRHLKFRHKQLYKEYREAKTEEVPIEEDAALPNNLDQTKPAKSLKRYFEYLPDNAKCRIDECQKVLSRTTGNTASMTRHLESQHNQLFKKYMEAKTSV
jgi:uncharacterized membrane-anchored protein YhcB (DUF1043 family)